MVSYAGCDGTHSKRHADRRTVLFLTALPFRWPLSASTEWLGIRHLWRHVATEVDLPTVAPPYVHADALSNRLHWIEERRSATLVRRLLDENVGGKAPPESATGRVDRHQLTQLFSN
jgi:hypothetical protein